MKLTALSLVVFLNLLTTPYAWAQWTWLNPKPSGLDGRKITFVDTNTGFIVNDGEVLRTTDAGASWEIRHYVKGGGEMAFNGNTGFIVGHRGIVYQSGDRGASWQEVAFNTIEDLKGVHIPHPDTIYITGSRSFFRSYNGGATWSAVNTIIAPFTNLTFTKSFFTSSLEGHIVCSIGIIYKTVDGGATWYITESKNASVSPSNFWALQFINKRIGFASRGHWELLKTTDGGETWFTLPSTSDAAYSIYFLDENTGYISGKFGIIRKTTNGGKTWQWVSFQNEQIDATSIYGLFFTDAHVGYAVGQRGRITKTTDGGNTWKDYGLTYNTIHDLLFPTDDVGFALGSNLYKTTDKGESWNMVSTGLAADKYRYMTGCFSSEKVGFVVAKNSYENVLLKTEDGGKSWDTKLNGSTEMFSLHFINDRIGFLAMDFGLFRTADGGETWEWVSDFSTYSKIHFIDQDRGFTIRYGDLYQTYNGGLTWAKSYEVFGDLTDFSFVNSQVGYVSGQYGEVLKTTDGGASWIELNVKAKTQIENLKAIAFYNENVGYATGQSWNDYSTSDGGHTWQLLPAPVRLDKLLITKGKQVFGVGEYGKIVRRNLVVEEVVLYALEPEDVSDESVELIGAVASNGGSISDIRFEYGAEGKFSNSIPVSPDSVTANSAERIKQVVTGLVPNTTYSFRVRATYQGQTLTSQPIEFKTKTGFEVTLYNVEGIDSHSVYLFGSVTSHRHAISNIRFEYGTDATYANHLPATPDHVAPGANATINAKALELKPLTTYYARIRFTYQGQEHTSHSFSFAPPPGFGVFILIPRFTGSATHLAANLESLKGPITNIQFQYGKTIDMSSVVDATPPEIGAREGKRVEASVAPWEPGTMYYYRLKAIQDGREIYSRTNEFRAEGDILVETEKADNITHTSAQLGGLVASQGEHIPEVHFDYGPTVAYGQTVRATGDYASGSQTVAYRATVENLNPNTTYHYRMRAQVNGNTQYGSNQTFSTGVVTSLASGKDEKLRVYPNPTQDRLILSHEEAMEQVEVYDRLGRLVHRVRPGEKAFSLDLSAQSPGIYFLRIYSNHQTYLRKVVKQ